MSSNEHCYGLFIDIEVTGPLMTENWMLCFAAVLANFKTGKIEKTFDAYLTNPKGIEKGWDTATLAEFWDKPENIKMKEYILNRVQTEGVPAGEAMRKFVNWVRNLGEEVNEQMVVFTDTAGFDQGWINYHLSLEGLLPLYNINNGKYKATRDSSSYHMGLGYKTIQDGLYGSTDAAATALGIKKEEFDNMAVKKDHNPLNDAIAMATEALIIHAAVQKKKTY